MMRKPIQLPPNTIIGAWKPTQLLGHGGQGAVWAAKPYKVKHTPQRALKACFASPGQARERFRLEIETLRRCDSPNILKVYDHDLDWKEHVSGLPPFAYYVAEKCQGSLEKRIAELGDARRRLALFRQACAAVSYLHTMPDPVIHRDIKPENFLLGYEFSNVLLADFGIVRASSEQQLTEVFEIVGTPHYRAPEVLNGARGTIESDVYGLGRLLEWLLTGAVSTEMTTRPVPRGLELDDDACNILDGVIAKATQASPAHRYPSVEALSEQLPELWISVKPRARAGAPLPDTSETTVLAAALALARAKDHLGWRELQNQLRREYVARISAWRTERELRWRGDRDKEAGVEFTSSLLDVTMGRLTLGLAGVYSTSSELADQRHVIDDLVFVPGWNGGGTTAIVNAPYTLGYLFHYLHGALCMAYRQPDLALQLARMHVPDAQTGGGQLCKDYEMVGWPKLLCSDVVGAWKYLGQLWERRPVLQQFFALRSDYDSALAAYSMLLMLHELAEDAIAPAPLGSLTAPPLFMVMTSEAREKAMQITMLNRQTVARVADVVGAKLDSVRALWPSRRKVIYQYLSDGFGRTGYWDTRALPGTLG